MKVNISKSYGEKAVLDGFAFDFPEGEITAVVGVSGAGKTTLLNAMASLTTYEGENGFKGKDISYVFQTPRLIPAITLEKNIEFALSGKIKDVHLCKQTAQNALMAVGLFADRAKYPGQLSGGMAQRASLARAFFCPCSAIFMDEPFKECDAVTKKRLTDLFVKLYSESPKTVVLVTHDIEEALTLAGKVAVLKDGKVFKCYDAGPAAKTDAVTLMAVKEQIMADLI